MAAEMGKNKRVYCTLAPATVRYLERLAALGTHGCDVPGVMASLIQQGIRQAIEKNYIDKGA